MTFYHGMLFYSFSCLFTRYITSSIKVKLQFWTRVLFLGD